MLTQAIYAHQYFVAIAAIARKYGSDSAGGSLPAAVGSCPETELGGEVMTTNSLANDRTTKLPGRDDE